MVRKSVKQTKAQQQMENLLQRVGGQVNVVYNINEPAARGSYQALKHRFADMKPWLEASHAIADAAPTG